MFERSISFFIKINKVACLLVIALISACGGGSGGGSDEPADPFATDQYGNLKVFQANSPYASLLKDCVIITVIDNSCALTDLPLLIEDGANPTVANIMDRLLVSHDWMGNRFREVLETYPNEILQLFTGITSIVIDDDIRPSYYDPDTSTIYLDAAYLWLLNSEKATITQEDDFRSSFDDELNFVSLARFVDGFNYAWDYYALDDNIERDIADIRFNFAHLLLHELMHANDFFPPEQTPSLDQNQSLYEAQVSLSSSRISTQLVTAMPLNSNLMYRLAEVMYLGDAASAQERQLTATEVGDAMENDDASDDYAYTSQWEDAAMLFSEAMMKYLFNLDRDIAYTNRPNNDVYCSDYVVAWGVRGRIGDVNVKDRAQFVVEKVYLNTDFSLFFQNLAAPKFMRAGDDWCENLAVF